MATVLVTGSTPDKWAPIAGFVPMERLSGDADDALISIAGAGPRLLLLTGTGFTYGAGALPLTGSITGLQVIAGAALPGVPLHSVSGINVTVAAFAAATGDLWPLLLGGPDTLLGGAGADRLGGFTGDDSIAGGAGNDLLLGADGDDSLVGDAGADTLFGEAGDDVLQGAALDDVLHGGGGKDTLRGDAGADRLIGGGDADLLDGGDGDDTLNGGDGVATLRGGLGNDTFVVMPGERDVLQDTGGIDTVLVFGGSYGGNLGTFEIYRLALGGELLGDRNANVLLGSSQADVLRGGRGNDSLAGGGDADTIEGGLGADTLAGGAGNGRFIFGQESWRDFKQDTVKDFSRADGNRDVIDLSSVIDLSAIRGTTPGASDQGEIYDGGVFIDGVLQPGGAYQVLVWQVVGSDTLLAGYRYEYLAGCGKLFEIKVEGVTGPWTDADFFLL